MGAQKGKKAARTPSEVPGPVSAAEPVIERAVQERIGTHLRAMYDDLMQQPVPDRFAELLGKLEARGDDKAQ